MTINNHAKNFLTTCSFYIRGDYEFVQNGERDIKKSLTTKNIIITNLVSAIIVYAPIVNNFMLITFLIRNRKVLIETAEYRGIFAQAIIGATGLGILLLPVHIVGTVARKIYNASHEEKIFTQKLF